LILLSLNILVYAPPLKGRTNVLSHPRDTRNRAEARRRLQQDRKELLTLTQPAARRDGLSSHSAEHSFRAITGMVSDLGESDAFLF
jgi:hypothetical protein